jgi:hypothetical protein
MTISKAQGQTLKRLQIYQPSPVFNHVQLHVVFSRSSSLDSVTAAIIEGQQQSIENDKTDEVKYFVSELTLSR